jgi:hypothetical protein
VHGCRGAEASGEGNRLNSQFANAASGEGLTGRGALGKARRGGAERSACIPMKLEWGRVAREPTLRYGRL